MGPTALLPLGSKSCYGFLSPLKVHHPLLGLNPRTWGPIQIFSFRILGMFVICVYKISCVIVHCSLLCNGSIIPNIDMTWPPCWYFTFYKSSLNKCCIIFEGLLPHKNSRQCHATTLSFPLQKFAHVQHCYGC
jgi:hypothetical protein